MKKNYIYVKINIYMDLDCTMTMKREGGKEKSIIFIAVAIFNLQLYI